MSAKGDQRYGDGGGLPSARNQRADPPVKPEDRLFYRWKARYGGLEASDARKLKGLEDENRRLKKLLAEAMLDVASLKDLLGKN